MSETFFYYSRDAKSSWDSALADKREQVIRDKQPGYVSVLDLDQLLNDDSPKEELLKVKYSGPFYADWDCEDIEDGAVSVNKFLNELADKYEVDLRSVSIYATGGRGYHVEVPYACFAAGRAMVQYLPQIYKEVAHSLYTEDLDLKIYSAKRGRMWRTPNVQRENGNYKVPITLGEMRDMTASLYTSICSGPRDFPKLVAPVLSAQLAALFVDHKKKVEQRYREQKNKKVDDTIIRRMNGEWPASVLKVMGGENYSKDVGLNKIAMQLGILSSALGKTLDEHIEACRGLISAYKGDHATKRAVRGELKRLFNYVDENPAYIYSPTAMKGVMQDANLAMDLNGKAQSTSGIQGDLSDLTVGMINGENGIYSLREDVMKRETNWHFDPESVTEIIDAETGSKRGFILRSMDGGSATKEVSVEHTTFNSAEKARAFFALQGATSPRIDTAKAGGILSLVMAAAKRNDTIYALSKEGFHWVDREDHRGLVWSSPYGCYAHDSHAVYRFRGTGGDAGALQSDVMLAERFPDTRLGSEVLEALLSFNLSDFTVGLVLGWFLACWHKPLHVMIGRSFPILQAYGESGAGKTDICALMLKMFYFKNQPRMINASQGSSFGRRTLMSAATSVPVLVDEFKPRKMSLEQVREFRMMIHEMYTPSFQAPRGGGDPRSGDANSWATLSMDVKTTPMCFTTETAETETAIQERTLSAPFSKKTRMGKAETSFELLQKNIPILASLGRTMLDATASLGTEELVRMIEEGQSHATASLSRAGNSRIVYNAGVAVSGLVFMRAVIKRTLSSSGRIQARIDEIITALLNPENYATLQAAPEIVKLLRFMITVSTQDDLGADHNVKHGVEYVYVDGFHVDISVDAFYLRYRTAAQRRSQSPLFEDPDSFLAALRSSSLLLEDNPPDSTLHTGTNNPRVVRLSGEALAEHKLGSFRLL